MELESRYESRTVEARWREIWAKSKAFQPQVAQKTAKEKAKEKRDKKGEELAAYSIVIPPPNVTGKLHVGHALNQTIQDILIRYARKQGLSTLWLPGNDHAGIATQVKVEQYLKEKGLDRQRLGREKFLKEVWAWKEKYGGAITEQQRQMGFSLDWSRERFTMDEGLSIAVVKAFVGLYEKGLIYRDNRMVNWDPETQTVLSDLEIEHEENYKGELYSFAYPLPRGNSPADKKAEIVVATTRPETMLGDSAVAVHPQDERYRDLIGKVIEHPFTGRRLPIIADAELVDPNFGSGVVKVTPAHDPNDFAVGKRHNLDFVNIFDPSASINENGGQFKGQDRYQARQAIKEELARRGLERGSQKHTMSIARSQRSGAIVEPIISTQWFVRTKPLAKAAMQAVRSGQVKFLHPRWEHTYFRWMEEIRDWCISRQLWWGHRIPAWYGPDQKIFVAHNREEALQQAGKHYGETVQLEQDPDVLDTWFSSALWPFSTLGWPQESKDLREFYPGAVLVTSFDIIFFWVARMIMMGLYFMKKVPFKEVYIHGLIRDAKRQKMSKTRGNVVDPLQTVDTYGADAFRFFLTATLTEGKDILYSEQRLKGYQNFCNKLWNSSRFVLMNLPQDFTPWPIPWPKSLAELPLETEDYWILDRFNNTIGEMESNMKAYRFHLVAEGLYDFVWHQFCDWYIELIKPRVFEKMGKQSAETACQMLYFVLMNSLGLLHPIMPFITEEIHACLLRYTNSSSTNSSSTNSSSTNPCSTNPSSSSDPLMEREQLMTTKPWPQAVELPERAKGSIETLALLQEAIIAARLIRSEAGITPDKKISLLIRSEKRELKSLLKEKAIAVKRLANAQQIDFQSRHKGNSHEAMEPFSGGEVFLILDDPLEVAKEIERLKKEKSKLKKEITFLSAKLSNPAFLEKAPKTVTEGEREKLRELQGRHSVIQKALERFGAAQ